METARRVFEAANVLGAKYVRMFSFYASVGKEITEMRGEVLDALEKLVLLAHSHGVTLCHENEAKIYGDTPERCRDLLDYFGGELKCVFDMGNFVLENVEPYAAYELLKKDIAYFHIKDGTEDGVIVPAGMGNAKIQEILAEFRADNDIFVSLEPHLAGFVGLGALTATQLKHNCHFDSPEQAFSFQAEAVKEILRRIGK